MNKKGAVIVCVVFFTLFLFDLTNLLCADSEVAQINRAISEKGAKWQATETWLTKLPPEERQNLFGLLIDPSDLSDIPLITLPQIENLPSKFDWRDNNGDWTTPIKNQHYPRDCGSCWAFATVAQVEAWWKIINANPDSMIDLSEQFLLSCSGAGGCDGGYYNRALAYISSVGIPSEACLKYQADDQIPCQERCDGWRDERVQIPGWGFLTAYEPITETIKNAVYRQPISTSMDVYDDFLSYSGGIYEQTWGNFLDGHVVLIIGWDDEEQCWICKNSHGTEWGETASFSPFTPGAGDGGYFRIKWSDSRIGINSLIIWNDMTVTEAPSLSPRHHDLILTAGDSTNIDFTLENRGNENLEYAVLDYESPISLYFHPDSFNAWDGLSWWCGDPQLGGYENEWLQYLDLPSLDLSSTSAPTLSWMGYWAVEMPQSYEGYDGWDGCNVWISTDGGKTFRVASPNSPEYNCENMYSFGSNLQWNLGENIAGWGGYSVGWKPIELDLSDYRSDSVVVRFAFASDAGLSTADDQQLYGFFIDDIVVSDGTEILFENAGESDSGIRRIGHAGIEPADWINSSRTLGIIPSLESVSIPVSINTMWLQPGHYCGTVLLSANVSSPIWYSNKVYVDLSLRAPDCDLAIEDVWPLNRNIPILVSVDIAAKIKNVGLEDVTDIVLDCELSKDGQSIFNEPINVPSLRAGEDERVKIKTILETQTADVEVEVSVENVADDYNAYNNRKTSVIHVTNLVDDFENDTDYWGFEGGWGIVDKYARQVGGKAVYVNADSTRYANNMDAKMTFTPGFVLDDIDKATLTYWVRCNTYAGDSLFVEASADSVNWLRVDEVSGIAQWGQRAIDLVAFLPEGDKKLWIRFRFVSDDDKTKFGVAIDDVEIDTQPVDVQLTGRMSHYPERWSLEQNYPNPFNPATTIEYDLVHSTSVQLTVYDVLGRQIKRLVDTTQEGGHHKITWDAIDDYGNQVAAGIYFYRLKTDEFSQTHKMAFVR